MVVAAHTVLTWSHVMPTDGSAVKSLPSKSFSTPKVKAKDKYRADVSKKQRLAWVDELGALEQYAKVIAQTQDFRAKFTARNVGATKKSLRALGMTMPGDPARRAAKMEIHPYLELLHVDDAYTENFVKILEEGDTAIGRPESRVWKPPDLVLRGLGILAEHCLVTNGRGDGNGITITPEPDARVFVNGDQVEDTTELSHNDRIVLGYTTLLRFIDPAVRNATRTKNEERRERRRLRASVRAERGLPPEPEKAPIVDPQPVRAGSNLCWLLDCSHFVCMCACVTVCVCMCESSLLPMTYWRSCTRTRWMI